MPAQEGLGLHPPHLTWETDAQDTVHVHRQEQCPSQRCSTTPSGRKMTPMAPSTPSQGGMGFHPHHHHGEKTAGLTRPPPCVAGEPPHGRSPRRHHGDTSVRPSKIDVDTCHHGAADTPQYMLTRRSRERTTRQHRGCRRRTPPRAPPHRARPWAPQPRRSSAWARAPRPATSAAAAVAPRRAEPQGGQIGDQGATPAAQPQKPSPPRKVPPPPRRGPGMADPAAKARRAVTSPTMPRPKEGGSGGRRRRSGRTGGETGRRKLGMVAGAMDGAATERGRGEEGREKGGVGAPRCPPCSRTDFRRLLGRRRDGDVRGGGQSEGRGARGGGLRPSLP
ncbi:hypothetical protein PVAP13_8NG158701 [Panicum virgatum]|uniref:Uncharacterized protein n=1 Tax=Panicum virgatum TaxID=38727 RepID=A0A8T0P9U6_PANVG|nr:hypothetical protein PVAP13_8NG158701 [Panicum virgatum]